MLRIIDREPKAAFRALTRSLYLYYVTVLLTVLSSSGRLLLL
jgi:hypothetical protein